MALSKLICKIRLHLVIMAMALWAVPAILFIRLSARWIKFRVGALNSHRVGHFVADAAIYLAYENLYTGRVRQVCLYWYPSPACNEQFATMVARQLKVRWWARYLILFNDILPCGEEFKLPSTNKSRDILGLISKSESRFNFLDEECCRAKSWLKRRGWRDGEKFVCLLVRDSAYLEVAYPSSNTSYSYHDYRDSDIDVYEKSVKYLLGRGYWVIRMSKVARKKMSIRHERFIDYPFVRDQDDLLDIWLSANCHFFISTATGIDAVPYAYNVPCVWVNFLPIANIASWTHLLWMPKKVRWGASGRLLGLEENLKHSFQSKDQYASAGLAIEDLNEEEILCAVQEMEARLMGAWSERDDDKFVQDRIWSIYRNSPGFSQLHGYRHPELRIARSALDSFGYDYISCDNF